MEGMANGLSPDDPTQSGATDLRLIADSEFLSFEQACA
jgi:hypothetical protein